MKERWFATSSKLTLKTSSKTVSFSVGLQLPSADDVLKTMTMLRVNNPMSTAHHWTERVVKAVFRYMVAVCTWQSDII